MSKRVAIFSMKEKSGKNYCGRVERGASVDFVSGVDSKVAILEYIAKELANVPNNDEYADVETLEIFVADEIGKAIENASICVWIKKGKTTTTFNKLSDEVIAAAREVYVEYGKKNLNVRIASLSSAKNSGSYDIREFYNDCWGLFQDAIEGKNQPAAQPQAAAAQTQVNPLEVAMQGLNQDLANAVIAGDFTKVDELKGKIVMLSEILASQQGIFGTTVAGTSEPTQEQTTKGEQIEEPDNDGSMFNI